MEKRPVGRPLGTTKHWCFRDHDLSDPSNLYVDPKGKARCRICRTINDRRYKTRRLEMRKWKRFVAKLKSRGDYQPWMET